MPMTKQQALEVIKTIRHVYNIDFDRPKLETWVNILSQNGIMNRLKNSNAIYQ